MNYVQAIILSIIEGLTEFLPVSSTGHLILANKLLSIPNSDFVTSFNIMVQGGAILAVVYYYRQQLFKDWRIYKTIVISFIPTMIIGLVFYKLIKQYLLNNALVTIIALFIGGILLIILEKALKPSNTYTKIRQIPLTHAIGLGLFQSLAMIPGVSRSAATIIGGLLLGLDRTTAVAYSFLLAIPTMFAAIGLDLLESNLSFSNHEIRLLLIGFVISFVVALFSVSFLLRYVKGHSFIIFGVYRIILAILFFSLVGV